MKPNILFVTIDALRADKTYGKNKTSTTPHIDLLISKGVYFEQTIAAADQTGSSLASIFTSNFPITSGINQFNFSSKTNSDLYRIICDGILLSLSIINSNTFGSPSSST